MNSGEDMACVSQKALRLLASGAPESPADVAYLNAVHAASAAEWYLQRATNIALARVLHPEMADGVYGCELPELPAPDGYSDNLPEAMDDVKAGVLIAVIYEGLDLDRQSFADYPVVNTQVGQVCDKALVGQAIDELAETGIAEQIADARPFFQGLPALPFDRAAVLAYLCD